jgi:hypothetical protein
MVGQDDILGLLFELISPRLRRLAIAQELAIGC